jgi:hypothetical protein
MDVCRGAGQEHGGLAGGVAATDHDDLLALHEPCLDRGRGVVHPGAVETSGLGHPVEAPVPGAGRDDDGASAEGAAVVEMQGVGP